MAAQKKPRIIVVKEDQKTEEVAEKSIKSVIKSANILDAVVEMAGEKIQDEKDLLMNEELHFVSALMTDKEAEAVAKKAGVEAIEEDQKMYAFGEEEFADGGFADDMIEPDVEAETEIAESMAMYDTLCQMSDEDAMTAAESELHRQPCIGEDIDFDEFGNLISLNSGNQALMDAGTGAGIPKDKVVEFAMRVIQNALKEMKGGDISEQQIEGMMEKQGLVGTSESIQAMRDYITCGIQIIYANYAWRYSTGSGVRVAVVDTGIASRHPDLRVSGGVSFVPGVRSWNDDQGHGTHVAGTIAATANNRGVVGVAHQARLYAVKVLDRNGSGYTSWILNGLAWCYRSRMHIANLSLGGIANNHDTNDYSRAYEQAGKRLRNRGILACAAAGNSGQSSNPYVGNPARCPSFMAVSAVDCDRRRAAFSSYGPQTEITAPGVSVWSTYPPNTYKQLNGTSMACPHVAAVAALIKRRNPSWSGDRIRVHMWRTAMDLGRSGRDWFYGYGMVNALRAIR